MTLSQRIKRIEELRRDGIDWSEMDRAMYGPLPVRRSEFSRRLAEKRVPVKDWYNGAAVPSGDRGAA